MSGFAWPKYISFNLEQRILHSIGLQEPHFARNDPIGVILSEASRPFGTASRNISWSSNGDFESNRQFQVQFTLATHSLRIIS